MAFRCSLYAAMVPVHFETVLSPTTQISSATCTPEFCHQETATRQCVYLINSQGMHQTGSYRRLSQMPVLWQSHYVVSKPLSETIHTCAIESTAVLGRALCRTAHLTDEPEVVADQHHAAIPLVDGSRQRVNCLHVQVICRLILHI